MRKIFITLASLLLIIAAPVTAQDVDKRLATYNTGDYVIAIKEWTLLAKAEDSGAQFSLRIMYDNGFGVPQDDKDPIKWDTLAAKQCYAKARVAELNATFTDIITEAQAHVALATHEPNSKGPQVAVALPRYHRARLLGEQPVHELAKRYLEEASQKLRPGSFKSVHYALELLVSHLGQVKIGEVSGEVGREILSLISKLSPNIRKYSNARGAGLANLAALSEKYESVALTPQTQTRIFKQMQQFLDWCVNSGELARNPWEQLRVKDRPEVFPHKVLRDEHVTTLLNATDRVLHSALLFGLLTGMRSGEICGLMAEDVTRKGNLGRFIQIRPNAVRRLKSKAAQREVPLHSQLETLLDTTLPTTGRLFPHMTVDWVVKRYARLRRHYPDLGGTVFHSTRKWFITQCELHDRRRANDSMAPIARSAIHGRKPLQAVQESVGLGDITLFRC